MPLVNAHAQAALLVTQYALNKVYARTADALLRSQMLRFDNVMTV